MKILVTPTSFGENSKLLAKKRLEEFADEIIYNPYNRPLTEDEIIPLLNGCDGYIAGLDIISARVLQSYAGLKVVSRYGTGFDRVDIVAAKECGIAVTNTPGVNAQAVADLAFGLILSITRKIPMLDRTTKEGSWIRATGIEVYGKTIGILGLGAIGKNVANRAKGFEMQVLAYDPYIDEAYAKKNNIKICSFEEIITRSDIISLHLPLNEQTRHIIGKDAFKKMKTGAIIVNTSRGGIIDEDAAIEALVSGKLGGLGLDAFEVEPPLKSKLFELDNVVLTPHTGARTIEATENMAEAAVDNLITILQGKSCGSVVNGL